MTDYNLGRAHGKIEIDYEDSGMSKAIVDLDKATASSDKLDESLTKTGKTLDDTGKEMQRSGTSAEGYSQRLKDVKTSSEEVDKAEAAYKKTLLDTKSTLSDIESAHERVTAAKQRHTQATNAERDAHKALGSEMSAGQQAMRGLSDIIPNLGRRLSELATVTQDAEKKSNGLARGLSDVAKLVVRMGPEGAAAAGGLELVAKGLDKTGQAASAGGSHIRDFVKDIAGFEAAFGKIAGLTLAVPSLGGLAGIGGAAGVQGIVEMADAVRQLSGALGLLPAAVSGAAVVMGTMKIALHGVGDALKDMMADDPKKFLQDIANMGPAAAHSMLMVAQFRDQFKLGGAAIQDSFFTKIMADIQPLIQTWLPALVSAGSKIAGIMGAGADQFAKLMMQPQTMQAFTAFIDNISKGMLAMQPAMQPVLHILQNLSVVGSGFFQQIGGAITRMMNFFDGIVSKAAQSGELQQWIQTGINAFSHLINAAYLFGAAFNDIMNIAEKFGGGGLLGFVDKIAGELSNWTQSAAGQKSLTDFFTTLREATDAFLPMLKPLLDGFVSIGSAFAHLGIDTAPAWLDFFKTFAYEMANDLGPAIQGMGPAVSTFLMGLGDAFRQLMQTLGPQLPQIFQDLANAFLALLPQIPQMALMFAELVEHVGPQLPELFRAVTQALEVLVPLMPQIIELTREFVSAVTLVVDVLRGLIDGAKGLNDFLGKTLPDAIKGIAHAIETFFSDLPGNALHWGEDLLKGFIDGMQNKIGDVEDWLKRNITDHIPQVVKDALGIQSPSKVFHEIGVNLMQGLQQGLAAGAPGVLAQTSAIAQQVTGSMSSGVGGALAGSGGAPAPGGAEGVGGALLPNNIAGADTSVLDKYLSHQFDDKRGLKGLAKDFGDFLSVFQNGFNLISQHVMQPMIQAMGMIPALAQQPWVKMSPQAAQEQALEEMQRKALEAKPQDPTWGQVLGNTTPGDAGKLSATAGGAALDAALKAKGFSPQQIRVIQGFSQVEGNNPAGNPTLGFTDDQLGGRTDLQSHVDALAKQFIDRTPVAGQFPENGTDLQRSQWISKVVGQSGLSSDWQGNAQPQDYVQRVLNAMPGPNGPTWQQITGGGVAVPGMPPIAPAPTSAGLPPGFTPWLAGQAGTGGAGHPLNFSQLPDVRGAHPQLAYALAAAQQLFPGLVLTAGKDDHGVDQGWHPRGQAIDVGGPDAQMAAFSNWLLQFAPDIEELIHSGTGVTQNIKSGNIGPAIGMPGSVYTLQQAGYHGDHVHLAVTDPMAQAFEAALGGAPIPPGALNPGAAASTLGLGGQTGFPDVNNAFKLLNDTTGKQLSVNDQLLQAYLQGNPALAGQINAAKTPGASDAQVQQALTGISTTITGLKAQDAIGNKNTIQALQSTQSQIAQQQGFTQGQSPVQMFGSIASGASNIASSVIQTIQGGLDSLTATQDIADRMVYGLRNTEDLNKIVDDVQKYITFAADIANTTGQILSTIGSFAGAGGDAAGPGGGSAGAALSMAGQVAQLISGILQGVNAAIDFSQQVYHIAGQYVGRFLSTLTGMAGTPLMGNVRMELNKNTGQLIAYSEDNPQNQDVMKVPSWLNQTYDYGGGGNPNPQVGNQFVIYGGPGQSAGQLLNQSMWLANTRGTSGAMAGANF
jgi:phage-related protein